MSWTWCWIGFGAANEEVVQRCSSHLEEEGQLGEDLQERPLGFTLCDRVCMPLLHYLLRSSFVDTSSCVDRLVAAPPRGLNMHVRPFVTF